MRITGLTIVRNGVTNGYVFVETIECLLTLCDEVVVLEGYSDDSTMLVLEALQHKHPGRITLYRDEWQLSSGGHEFARITNVGISRCKGDYIAYLQADEVLHEDAIAPLRDAINSGQYGRIGLHFKHFRLDLHRVINSEGAYPRAVRVVKNIPGIGADHDAYTLGGGPELEPGLDFELNTPNYWCYHVGYVFAYNILTKMINHANRFYQADATYRARAEVAGGLLTRLLAGETFTGKQLHQALEPHWPLVMWYSPLPRCLAPHVGAMYYDPRKALPDLPPLPELAGLRGDVKFSYGDVPVGRVTR
jgi:glycosyltransferase involved in cell wall biosynthesis